MNDKKVGIRFDVDTPRCMQKGVPQLLDLARQENIPFTFFINMGKSIDRTRLLKPNSSKQKEPIKKLSTLEKQSPLDIAQLLLINPYVGKNGLDIIKQCIDEGHEVGLHGGKNHACWQHSAHHWNKLKVETEVLWGLNEIIKVTGEPPAGFSSPGWNSPEEISPIIDKAGFSYLADSRQHGKKSQEGYNNIATTLLGEPGGVGFLEYCKATNIAEKDIFSWVTRELEKSSPAVLYDHPCYAGFGGKPLLKKLINFLKAENIQLIKLCQASSDDN